MHIVHTENSCGWGGQEIRILTESKGLKDRGHKITIVCDPNSKIYLEAGNYGLDVVGLAIDKKRLRCLKVLRRWIAQNRNDIDVINTHSSTDSWLTAVACATLKNPPAVVRTRHVSSEVKNTFANRWLYGRAVKHVAVTGEKVKQQLISGLDLPAGQFTSVRTGIDLNRFFPGDAIRARASLELPPKLTVGILATMRGWKGHSYLIDAFADVLKTIPDLQLLMVGDGPMREKLSSQVKGLGIDDSVLAVGNQENPEDWLKAMDIFVLPSWGNEGVSQSVMQAMATGLPVIATDVGAMTEAVHHLENGIIVETKSSVAIASALADLLGDTKERKRLAENALAFATNNFGSEKMLDQMEAIFSAAIKS